MCARRVAVVVLAVALLAGGALPTLADVVDRSVTAVEWGLAAECRRLGTSAADDERCAAIDGRTVSSARIDAYRTSWVHRALALQRSLDDAVPLTESLFVHTHNSFNSSSYDPTLTNQDPNQAYSLTDQLEMDVRALELDVHWVPSRHGTLETGGHWPTLCHGNSSNPAGVHVGCSDDRPLEEGLAEIATWLASHPSELVLLYLENQLGDDPTAHAVAGSLVDDVLGPLVYRPPASAPCAAMDWSTSEDVIRASGARVVVVGNCDTGVAGRTPWGALVHQRGPQWDEGGDPTGYSVASPACAEDRADVGVLRRYFEDSTWLTEVVGKTTSISPEAAAAMVRCGVDLIGFDQLTPDDPRLAALVWSWTEDAVSSSGCGYQGADTRWNVDDCGARRRAACASGDGSFFVSPKAIRWDRGASTCASLGGTFAAPANGLRNEQLAMAKGVPEVWVNATLTPQAS